MPSALLAVFVHVSQTSQTIQTYNQTDTAHKRPFAGLIGGFPGAT